MTSCSIQPRRQSPGKRLYLLLSFGPLRIFTVLFIATINHRPYRHQRIIISWDFCHKFEIPDYLPLSCPKVCRSWIAENIGLLDGSTTPVKERNILSSKSPAYHHIYAQRITLATFDKMCYPIDVAIIWT